MVSMFCERQTFTVLVYGRTLSLLLLLKSQSKCNFFTSAQWLFTNIQARRVSSILDRTFIECYSEALGLLYACDWRAFALLDLQVRPGYAGV